MKLRDGLKLKLYELRMVMTERRFYFQVLGRVDCIYAVSRVEAQHKLMYSNYAPYYRYVQWL